MRRRHALACLIAVASLLVHACDRSALAPPTLEPLEITSDGTWFRDRMGRVVILRGATYTLTEGEAPVGNFGGDGERAIADMERLGMNLVRLPLSWRQIEPRPRRFAPHYFIERVDPVLRWAAAHGMAIVLSMRAWPYGACNEGDDSVPEWVCRTAKRAARSPEAPPGADPACAFWTARDPQGATLLDHYLDAWGVVAQYYAGDPRVIGLDLIDEPSGAGCFEEKPFLHGILTPFFRRLASNVRTFGYRNALLFEPPVAPGAPLPYEVRRLGVRAVYAPHVYGQRFGPGADATPNLGTVYDAAAAQAKALHAPLLVGEYGGDLPPDASGYRGSSRAFIAQSLAELDRLRIAGAYYALRPQSNESGRVEIGEAAYALAHPYARRIAGIPLEMRFDEASRELRLRFEEDAERSPPDPTEIYLPRALYAGGFDAHVSPAGRWSWDAHAQRLLVYRGASDDGTHEVVVRPGGAPRSIDRSEPAR